MVQTGLGKSGDSLDWRVEVAGYKRGWAGRYTCGVGGVGPEETECSRP